MLRDQECIKNDFIFLSEFLTIITDFFVHFLFDTSKISSIKRAETLLLMRKDFGEIEPDTKSNKSSLLVRRYIIPLK